MSLHDAFDYVTHPSRWLSRSASNAVCKEGLLGRMTEHQRKIAFGFTGPVDSWDDDVRAIKMERAAA